MLVIVVSSWTGSTGITTPFWESDQSETQWSSSALCICRYGTVLVLVPVATVNLDLMVPISESVSGD